MEEEQDRILLSSLGVKSANPEDIERVVLEKVAAVPASSLSLSLSRFKFTDSVSFEIDAEL